MQLMYYNFVERCILYVLNSNYRMILKYTNIELCWCCFEGIEAVFTAFAVSFTLYDSNHTTYLSHMTI